VRTVAEEYERVVGVDTHAATHTLTLLTAATGGVLEHRTFPTSISGLQRALSWITNRTTDHSCLVVVEGTGSYGARLTEHLTQGGIVVAEAPTIPSGGPKDDVVDSARIARAVLGLRLDQLCWPRAGGIRTAIRVLVSARDQMGTERTKTNQQSHRAGPQRRPRCRGTKSSHQRPGHRDRELAVPRRRRRDRVVPPRSQPSGQPDPRPGP